MHRSACGLAMLVEGPCLGSRSASSASVGLSGSSRRATTSNPKPVSLRRPNRVEAEHWGNCPSPSAPDCVSASPAHPDLRRSAPGHSARATPDRRPPGAACPCTDERLPSDPYRECYEARNRYDPHITAHMGAHNAGCALPMGVLSIVIGCPLPTVEGSGTHGEREQQRKPGRWEET